MKQRFDDISINTLVGQGTRINGDVSVNGFLRLDGTVMGNVKTDGEIITGSGSFVKGDVVSKTIVVGGSIAGNITARRGVTLLNTAVIKGSIVTQKLKADFGCVVNGKVICVSDDKKYTDALDKWQQGQL